MSVLSDPEFLTLYIGTYTRREAHVNGHGEGIYVYRFNPASGELNYQSTMRGVVNPSFVAVEPGGEYLYAVNELTRNEEVSGTVSAFAIDPATGNLTFLNKQPTGGLAPAYVSIHQNRRYVFAANYITGNVAVLPVQLDGRLLPASDHQQHHGSGPDPRQDGPHAHSILPGPSGRFVFSADLGTDQILIYEFDSSQGRLLPHDPAAFNVEPGSGPRHLTFHPNGRFMFVVTECSSQIYALAYDADDGTLTLVETKSTLPEDYSQFSAGADIHTSQDGRFLYASSRGQDSIAIFAIDGEAGLTLVDHEFTQGKCPRNFTVDPSGNFLLVANQDSDSVVVFRRDPGNGKLTSSGAAYRIPSPVCLRFAPSKQRPKASKESAS